MFLQMLMVGLNHRRLSLIFLLAVTLLTAFGLPRLRIDTGFSSLISATDPSKQVYDKVAKEFGSDNRTLIYVRDEALWTPDKLAALEMLHRSLETLPFVERVDDLFTLRSVRGKDGSIESRLLMTEAPKDQAAAERIRQDALYNPLIIGNYLSQDGTVTALMVSVRENLQEEGFDRRINGELEALLAPFHSHFSELFQIGPPRINAELKSSLFDDMVLLAPLSVLLLVVTILFFLRSVFAAVVPIVTSLLSIVWAFGLMGWAGIPINILSAMLPSLVVVIGSTEDTHMMSTYFHGLGQSETERREAATRLMMRHMGIPMLLTILTTGMGFASNIFSDIGLIQDFAIASTLAILANGIITIILVPMLLKTFGPLGGKTSAADSQRVQGIPAMMVRLFGASQKRYSHWILLVTALLCAFFVYQASKLHVTNDPLSYFRGDRPLIQQAEQIQRDLSGTKVFFITLQSEDDRAFLEPRLLHKLEEIQAFMRQQGVFDRSISLADYIALINREFHDGDAKYLEIPARRELIAQYLLFFHRHDLESYISHDLKRATIVVRHNISDSATLNRNINELRDVVDKISGGELKGYVVGENLMINAAAESLMVAQVKSLGILLVVIFLTMSAMFTSLRGGLISLVPSLIPIILMFGVMGLFGIPLNPGTAMVAVIAIGIAIDGTIHLFSRYNELCRRTPNYEEAVERTVREEATPVVATSLALAFGFGILLFSNFTLVAQFGALSAATMLFSIFANLLITPIIMSRIRLVGLHQILALTSQKGVLDHSPLFEGMTDYQVRKAILISELHEFGAGELLIEQGSIGRNMYLILSGEAEVVRRDGDKSKHIASLCPGQVFGEIGFIRETKRTADVRALTPVSVLRFDFEKIRKDLKFFPRIVAKINYNISCILGERLGDIIEQQASEAANEQIARY